MLPKGKHKKAHAKLLKVFSIGHAFHWYSHLQFAFPHKSSEKRTKEWKYDKTCFINCFYIKARFHTWQWHIGKSEKLKRKALHFHLHVICKMLFTGLFSLYVLSSKECLFLVMALLRLFQSHYFLTWNQKSMLNDLVYSNSDPRVHLILNECLSQSVSQFNVRLQSKPLQKNLLHKAWDTTKEIIWCLGFSVPMWKLKMQCCVCVLIHMLLKMQLEGDKKSRTLKLRMKQ